MILLILRNNFISIKGANRKLIRAINSATSYKVAGSQFARSFQKGWWDGREKLLKYTEKHGYTFPAGLLYDVINLLEKHNIKYEIKDLIKKPKTVKDYDWNPDIILRPYQQQAVDCATSQEKIQKSKGILVMPIRSGKTITAAGIVHKVKTKALVVVPSQLLLHQTQESLSNSLMTNIGMIGDSKWSEHDVTVATVQSLAKAKSKKDPRYELMKKKYPLIIYDECFPAGTIIGNNKPIEKIKVGDYVESYDEHKNIFIKKRVSKTFKNKCSVLVEIKLKNGKKITCTPGHPFLTNNGWVRAIDLNKNSKLFERIKNEKIKFSKWIGVESVEIYEQRSDGKFRSLCPDGFVYNLEVEDTHTYVANGFVVHNCHHLVADTWKTLSNDMNAPYSIGLSATAEFKDDKQNELGVIWLRAICGEVLFEITTSELINQGYLQQPIIHLYKVSSPDMSGHAWNKDLTNKCIYENPVRNKMIVQITKQRLDLGENVLIIANRINHVKEISKLLDQSNINHCKITGSNTVTERKQMIQKFKSGETNVIVGTVFGEGIDIPEIVCVINAEGGTDIKSTKQRMRNLTTHKNKKQAIFVDFMDLTNNYLAKHSRNRLKVYKSEKSFILKVKQIKTKVKQIKTNVKLPPMIARMTAEAD
jgi:superfamily II DNA or RNA helicase